MKMTLLEMVQDILNDLDSDEVNHLDDTVEARQVAQILKTSYFEMIGNRNWPHLRRLMQIEPSGDVLKPNYLRIPENMKEIVTLKYDKMKADETRGSLQEIRFKYPDDFLRYVSNRDNTDPKTLTVTDYTGVQLYIRNDAGPSYWTSFDDDWIVCDSYDSAVDDTLQKHKIQCLAYVNPIWHVQDDAVPDLPVEAFPALLEEAKSTAFIALKQVANQKSEQKARRQQAWLSRKAWRTNGDLDYPDFGRKSRK
jgi:hypothetical protein